MSLDDKRAAVIAALDDKLARLKMPEEEQEVASSDEDVSPNEVVALEKEKVFRFFDLPRELRNRIYAETTTDVWLVLNHGPDWSKTSVEERDCALLKSAPCVKVSLINRQIQQEYEEEMDRKSTHATLTMALHDQMKLHERFDVNASLRRAVGRVHTLAVTHSYRRITDYGGFENDDMGGSTLMYMDSFLSMFSSLGHLKLVYYETMEGFQRYRSPFGHYHPADYDSAHVRRIFSSKFGGVFDESIEISTSVVLTEDLFTPSDSLGEFPGRYKHHPINRIVLHGPASLDPTNIDLAALEFDETESTSFEDLEEYDRFACRVVVDPESTDSLPGHQARVWNAGYHMVNEPCAHSMLNWRWLQYIPY